MIEMAKYAIIKDEKVINVCVWDGVSEWQPPEGTQAVKLDAEQLADEGYSYINGTFIAPPPPAPMEQPEERT